jgi:kynurenine 3-monooxygenase
MSESKNMLIAGAGLVGSLLSIYLAKKGHKVQVYEKRPDARKTNVYAGRSINLALSDRGILALKQVGIDGKILENAIPMYGRAIHNADGTETYQPYGKEGQAIYSVSRGGLNNLLLDLAEEQPNIELFFEHSCLGANPAENKVYFETEANSNLTVEADVIFATDGAGSAIRRSMEKDQLVESHTNWIEHGYKELSILPDENGNFRMEKNALHIWPRKDFMLIALPNPDKSFTLTLFLRNEGEVSFAALNSDEKVMEFFQREFADAVPMMDNLLDDWHQNPASPLGIVYTYPWLSNNTILLGDASHAIVPFYGQGMNSGFEDCYVLGQMMEEYDDWSILLDELQKSRKPDADAIAELAMRNFIEMRDLTGDPDFLLQKKIEARFAQKHPDKWTPLYSRVTFSHERYHEALAKGKEQDVLMKEVMQMPNIAEIWDSAEVENKILELLQKA